jgi:transcriptional regulator with XRE-family HTH domain
MPHPIDVLVGKRIRMRRTQKRLTQGELAEAVGVTFQQVQKYEKGTNRVSCSRLYDIAQTLEVPITYFFFDEGEKHGIRAADLLDLGDLKEGVRLVAAFGKVSDRAVRRSFSRPA